MRSSLFKKVELGDHGEKIEQLLSTPQVLFLMLKRILAQLIALQKKSRTRVRKK